MTVLTSQQITAGFALPSLAPASSPGPSGAGLGGQIHDTWQNNQIARNVGNAKQRRADLRKAAAAVEQKARTKNERLAAQQSGGHVAIRQAGSETERAATRGVVAKAKASLATEASDVDISDPAFRKIRETLRQRYPGASLSSMLQEAARMVGGLTEDPVAMHSVLVAAYSRAKAAPGFVEPVHSKGLRGSLQRAAQDQADAEDLRNWIALYGKRLPELMSEIEYTDRSLRANPSFEAAKLVSQYGAPAVAEEVPAYQAAQQQKYVAKRLGEIEHTVDSLIRQGHVPSDPDHLNEVAAVLQLPQFQHHPTDAAATFWRASQIAGHPNHQRITPRKGGKSNRVWEAGQKSISGAPGAGQGGRPSRNAPGSGSIRDSVRRVTEASR